MQKSDAKRSVVLSLFGTVVAGNRSKLSALIRIIVNVWFLTSFYFPLNYLPSPSNLNLPLIQNFKKSLLSAASRDSVSMHVASGIEAFRGYDETTAPEVSHGRQIRDKDG